MRLYIASTNPGKLRDFAHAAEDHLRATAANPQSAEPIHIEPLPGLADIPAPPEDELTFEANARAKAIYYSRHAPGALVLADDSGLEVACLENAPGVRSARYAEDQNFSDAPASTLDERNNAALLRALDGVPDTCRHARYRCALALARDGNIVAAADGAVEGLILAAPSGARGFGYDPLFFLPDHKQTMAEVDPVTRLTVSHRGRALQALLRQFSAM